MNQGLQTRWLEILGYAGLIPFLGFGSLSLLLTDTDMVPLFVNWNLLYGACIVSFLGAVHWGIVLSFASADHAAYMAGKTAVQFETGGLIWGVTPSLLAWVIVSFAPADMAPGLMASLVIFVWLIDRQMLTPLKAFGSYVRLRAHLTLGAAIGLAASAWANSLV